MIKTFSGDPHGVFTGSSSFHIGKIGGASLRNLDSLVRLPSFIKQEQPRILVVSALKGMTNILEKASHSFLNGAFEDGWDSFDGFLVKHKRLADGLGISIDATLEFFKTELQEVIDLIGDEPEEPEIKSTQDYILSFGERLSREIVMKYLSSKKIKTIHLDPRECIFVEKNKDGAFGEAGILLEKTRERTMSRIAPLVREDALIIMEGFIAGGNRNLGRNGSDTTLALVGICLYSMGITPAITYYKDEPFQTKAGKEVPGNFTKYSYFKNQMRVGEQSYVHLDAIELLRMTQLPFRVKSTKKAGYELIVGEDMTPGNSIAEFGKVNNV